jgi:WD40 repeat protein
MSSEPKRNFVLIQMDSIIYKYDLITKELLFRWKTAENLDIILYEKDDKLCTISKNSVRLWDFEDGIEQPPSIWATEDFPKEQVIDRVFINEGSLNENTDKESTIDDDFIVVCYGNSFRVYKNRLDRTNIEMTLDGESVTAACFSENNDVLFLGTSTGYIRFIAL